MFFVVKILSGGGFMNNFKMATALVASVALVGCDDVRILLSKSYKLQERVERTFQSHAGDTCKSYEA